MIKLLHIFRWATGLLFLASGLVKANDPIGLSYKMEEFMEALHLTWFIQFSLPFSVGMIAFEVVAGVALLLGWQMRLFSALLLLLITFFSFLTGYAVFSGKITACGCFGDCIPLLPMQSFIKDLILFCMIVFIFIFKKQVQPIFNKTVARSIFFTSLLFSMGLQWYVLKHLPIIDCLPFKAGNNLLQQMEMPANAIPDVFEIRFIYENNGKQQEFSVEALPDSTWKFIDRKQVLVKRGKNNQPPIRDFVLQTQSGTDTTFQLLNTRGKYFLLFIQHFEKMDTEPAWKSLVSNIAQSQPLLVVTGQPQKAVSFFSQNKAITAAKILSCDVTAIKTAARAIPTIFAMEGPVVRKKWSGADFDEIDGWIKTTQ